MNSLLAVVALVGRMVVLFAAMLLVPLAFAMVQQDSGVQPFTSATIITLAAGLGLSLVTRRFRRELQPRDGFLLVGLTWSLLPAFGAVVAEVAEDPANLKDGQNSAPGKYDSSCSAAVEFTPAEQNS